MSIASKLGDRFKAEFAGRIIGVVSGALLIVILARILDPDEYGLLFLAISVFGVIELFSKVGIAASAGRYIATYKETDASQLRHILRFSFFLNLCTITIVCIILLIVHDKIAKFIGEPDFAPFLALGIFFVAFATLMKFVRLILQGFEAIRATAALHALERGSRLIFAVALAITGYGAFGALIGYIIAYILAVVLGIGYVYHRYYQRFSSGERENGLRRRIAEYSIPLTATDTANVLDRRVDTLLVGFFVGPVGVAYYTIGKQSVQFIETPISALGFTLAPTFESLKVRDNLDKAARIYEEALVYGLLLYIPAAAGLVLIAEPLIKLVFGSEYLGAIVVLQVLAIYAVLQSITRLTSNALDFLGRARDRAIVKGATAILNVGLNIVLIPLVGVIGAAIATVVTFSMYTFANVYIMHTELELRLRFLLNRTVTTTGITAVMSVVIYSLVGYVTGFLTLSVLVGLGVGIWLALALATGLLNIGRIRSVLS